MQEFEEFLSGMRGEAVCRMGDDIGVDVVGEMEADGEAAGIGFGCGVSNGREAG
jgi:hypothetical protein